ncbi:hypothetical protein AGIG_G1557 [Arapaima gigas]
METAEGGVCANTGRSRGTSGRRLPRRRTVPDEGLILRRRVTYPPRVLQQEVGFGPRSFRTKGSNSKHCATCWFHQVELISRAARYCLSIEEQAAQ